MTRPTPLLRWLFLSRVALAAGIFAAALLVWGNAAPQTTLLATLLLLATLAFTGVSVWWMWRRGPGHNFLYLQVVFDAVLVTAMVHLTGPASSDLAPLYVLVIAEGAVLLPVPGGLLVAALSAVLYVADIIWQVGEPPESVLVQIGLFAGMALVTGWLGDRLRRTGSELGAVESRLRQLQLDTSDILDAMETGVVTVDGDGRLAYMNVAAERILGLPAREWMDRPVLAELDRRAVGLGAILQRTLVSRVPTRRYETWLGQNGRSRVLGVRTTVLEREGKPWVTAVCQDITDGRRVEDLHRRAERLEALAELSASLAHEIKNPLASIRSSVEQLTGTRLSERDRNTLQALVLTESDRLSRLLSEFIDFSRVELARSDPVDLAVVVREAVELAERHPDAAGAVAVDVVRNGEGLLLEGDHDLLHRAVFNLVLNAIQHAAGSGVRVEVRRAAGSELPMGMDMPSALRLRVSDGGPGIAAAHMDRIFDPFFTTRAGGSGLGLALVHRAVEAHGGAVFVDGGEGRGAAFTVYLPTPSGAGSADSREER